MTKSKAFKLRRIVSGPHKGEIAVFDEENMLGVAAWDPDDQEGHGADNPPSGASIDQADQDIADGLAAAKRAADWNKKNEKLAVTLSETGSAASRELGRAVNSYIREHPGVTLAEAMNRVTRPRPELWENYKRDL